MQMIIYIVRTLHNVIDRLGIPSLKSAGLRTLQLIFSIPSQ